MLSLRRSVELLYADTCSVYSAVEVFNSSTKQTATQMQAVAAGVPCRVSFSSVAAAGSGSEVTPLTQGIKLFLAPDVAVRPGSRIVVTRGGTSVEYKASGVPARYPSHQEVLLVLADNFA